MKDVKSKTMEGRQQILTARLFVEMYYYSGRQSRPDISHQIQLILKHDNLRQKFKYVSLLKKVSVHGSYESKQSLDLSDSNPYADGADNFKDVDPFYIFDHTLTFDEFFICMQLYDSCRTWSRTNEYLIKNQKLKFDHFSNPKIIGKEYINAMWFFSPEHTGRLPQVNRRDFRIWTQKFVQDGLNTHCFNDE